jgi:CrcB protein
MRNWLLVGAGGFAGSVARHYLGGLVLHRAGATRFPLATLTVNVLGCLVIGFLAGIAERSQLLSPGVRLLLFTGFLGGFTTFSAFGYESYFLARQQAWAWVAINVVLHLLLGLGGVWAGHRAGQLLAA